MALYDDHAETPELLRSFVASALLPINRIDEGFQLSKHKIIAADHKDQLRVFVSYFEKEWMHHYPPSTWSVGGKTWRTNNHAEGESLIFYSFAMKLLTNLQSPSFLISSESPIFFTSCSTTSESMTIHSMTETRRECHFTAKDSKRLGLFFCEKKQINTKGGTEDQTD